MKFQLFFFKENTRSLDVKELVDFLSQDENITIKNTDEEFSLVYSNKLVGLNYSFIFSRVSRVPDIVRLSPKYLDLDCYVEFDMLLPLFKVNMISSLIEKVCARFNFLIYNYLFEDVSPFAKDIISKAYDRARRIYKDKFPMEYQSLTYVSKLKLESYFKYLVDAKASNAYYNNQYLFLDAYFAQNHTTQETVLVASFRCDCALVIPANVDLVEIESNGNRFLYNYSEIEVLIRKHLKEFPGFNGKTTMIEEGSLKKVGKIISKMKIKPVLDRVIVLDQESLIDF